MRSQHEDQLLHWPPYFPRGARRQSVVGASRVALSISLITGLDLIGPPVWSACGPRGRRAQPGRSSYASVPLHRASCDRVFTDGQVKDIGRVSMSERGREQWPANCVLAAANTNMHDQCAGHSVAAHDDTGQVRRWLILISISHLATSKRRPRLRSEIVACVVRRQ